MVYVNMQHFVLFTYTYENATFGTKIKIQGMQEFEFSFAAQSRRLSRRDQRLTSKSGANLDSDEANLSQAC